MMRKAFALCLAALLAACAAPQESSVKNPPAAPVARREAIVDQLHGVAIADPYRWLEDGESAEVKAWADGQDAHARAILNDVKGHELLTARFSSLLYVDAISTPVARQGRLFYMRRPKGAEKSFLAWRDEGGVERVLIDTAKLSADGTTALGGWIPSPDGKLLAYLVKPNNADEATLRVRRVDTGEDLPDELEGAKYSGMSWTPDSAQLYYVWVPPVSETVTVEQRPGFATVRLHQLGSPQGADTEIFGATGDPETFLGVDLSEDGHFVFLYLMRGWDDVSIWYRDQRMQVDIKIPQRVVPSGAVIASSVTNELVAKVDQRAQGLGFQRLVVGASAVTSVTAYKDTFYLHTNAGAPMYRVLSVSPDSGVWREVIPEGATKIDAVQVAGEKLVVSSLDKAASRLSLWGLEGGKLRDLALPGLGSISGLSGEFDSDDLYYGFSTFTQPTQVMKLSLSENRSEVWGRVQLDVDTSHMVVTQESYTSKDGTTVTMFVVHRDDAKRDGTNPTLLYGYGGFNVDMTPAFSSAVVTWLELGGVYAIANLRGGGEYGEAWHQAGMLDRKQNVFDDFHAAAEHLISTGWTRPEKLAIRGGSNGGLLVGTAMTQRPELYGAVICAVPLLDMLRYHRFGSGRTWIPEYGSADEAAQFPYLAAYSPYHHVKAGTHYPALLMMGSDHDDRVDPMHARKFAAAIAAATAELSEAAPVLFRLERNAGHGGADLVKQTVAANADQFAFLAQTLGVDLSVLR